MPPPATPPGPRHHRGDLWRLWDTWGRHPGAVLVVAANVTRTRPGGRPLGPADTFGVMGAGQARAAAARFPGLADWWSRHVAFGGFTPVTSGWHPWPADPDAAAGGGLDPPRVVGCLVTKFNWWEPSPAWLVAAGLDALRAWADAHAPAGATRVVMPLPGAGLGKLPAAAAADLCRERLDGRFVVCTPV